MPKNALFLLKNRKNRKPLASGGPDPQLPQTPTGLRRLGGRSPNPWISPTWRNSGCAPAQEWDTGNRS